MTHHTTGYSAKQERESERRERASERERARERVRRERACARARERGSERAREWCPKRTGSATSWLFYYRSCLLFSRTAIVFLGETCLSQF
jgi:hypothetical protein